ncbi:MAG: carboxypeptidase regulatory-like domain-containing protein [Thermoplasmata archaeon]|nr:MAG: carboxypeptidase regulatory-like domain-containing protein [Thermoplasmata archaeon]
MIINFAGFNFIREARAADVKVYGYVIDEAYSPIWGAKVDFRPTTIFAYGDSCATDSSGYFEVHLMADTTYSVTVSAPPYYETYYGSYAIESFINRYYFQIVSKMIK